MFENNSLVSVLTAAIKKSNKKHWEVAKEVGYKHPNNIAMIITGRSKVSTERIPALAKSLDLCELELMEIALKEYKPETLACIKRNMVALTQEERKMIKGFTCWVNTRI